MFAVVILSLFLVVGHTEYIVVVGWLNPAVGVPTVVLVGGGGVGVDDGQGC